MVDYKKIITDLQDEKAACEYAYGGMVPAFYKMALQKAIEAIEKCQDCEAEALRG